MRCLRSFLLSWFSPYTITRIFVFAAGRKKKGGSEFLALFLVRFGPHLCPRVRDESVLVLQPRRGALSITCSYRGHPQKSLLLLGLASVPELSSSHGNQNSPSLVLTYLQGCIRGHLRTEVEMVVWGSCRVSDNAEVSDFLNVHNLVRNCPRAGRRPQQRKESLRCS